jgi:hypothetical protein
MTGRTKNKEKSADGADGHRWEFRGLLVAATMANVCGDRRHLRIPAACDLRYVT